MIKKHKTTLILTSVVILLPILAGLILWNQLPDQVPSHWDMNGQIDGWSSKPFTVFGIPLILLAAQWLCLLGSLADPKRDAHPSKILHLVLWIIPVLSALLHTVVYMVALGMEVRVERVITVFMGLLFAIIGNYLPKCKQNYTIGIKIPWTLDSEENWNKTHRLAGWLWVACGLVIMLTSFFGSPWLLFPVILVMVLAPTLYSYLLHRKGV